MIGLALAFLAGGLAACFVPVGIQSAVRAAGAALYKFVLPPAPNTPAPLYAAPMAVERVDIGKIIFNIASFTWRWKWVLIAVLLFVVIGGALRGCSPFSFVESREHAVTRANAAEGEMHTQLTINQRDAVISDIRTHVATARVTLQHLQEQGHAEIAAVTPPVETPIDSALVGAWRRSLSSLQLYPDPNGASAHPSGSSAQS